MDTYHSIVEKGRMREFLETLDFVFEKTDYVTEISSIKGLNQSRINSLKNFKVYYENIEEYAKKRQINLNHDSEKKGTRREFYSVLYNLKDYSSFQAEIGVEGIEKRHYYAYKTKNKKEQEELISLKDVLKSFDKEQKSKDYESQIKEIESYFSDYIVALNKPIEKSKQQILNYFFTVLKLSQDNPTFYEESYISRHGNLEAFVKEKMKKGINLDDMYLIVRNLITKKEKQVRERDK